MKIKKELKAYMALLKSPDYTFDEIELNVEVYWETQPSIKITRIELGGSDILPVVSSEYISEIIFEIENGTLVQQGSKYEMYSPVGVDYSFEKAESGLREPGSGQQLEPDYPERYVIESTYMSGNGKTIEIYLPEGTLDQMEENMADNF